MLNMLVNSDFLDSKLMNFINFSIIKRKKKERDTLATILNKFVGNL